MSGLDALANFVQAMAYHEVHPRQMRLHESLHPFVTISRQAGAGGHTLAETLAQQMALESDPLFRGWQVFDQQLCEKLLDDPKLRVSFRALLTEEYRTQVEDFIMELLGGESPQSLVVKKTFETLRTLANFGKVILVGRAGACVTRGLPHGVHVRLVAPEPARIKRMIRLLNVTEREAGEFVHRQDHDRAKLVRDAFGRDINDPLLYDVTWNTDAVPFEVIARSVIDLIKARVQQQGRSEQVVATGIAHG